ncbi:MAG: response regulator [bacterium]
MAKVLLVDDEKDFRDVLAQRMSNQGLDVDTAESGPRAIEMIDSKLYDAVIVDLAMPEMDGLETLQRLLKKQPNLQIIVLTGQASVAKGVEAMKMGAVDFLEKPAKIESLVKKIEQAEEATLTLFEKDLDKKINDITGKKGW